MRVMATNHTSFTVADLDATVAFFVDALGFSVRWPPEPSTDFLHAVTGVPDAEARVAVVMCPGHAIELFQYAGPADRIAVKPRACDTGFAHIAFEVDDLDAAIAGAAAHGFHPLKGIGTYRSPTMALRATYLQGPDGLAVELVEMAQA